MYCSLLNLRLLTVQIQAILTLAGLPLLSFHSFCSLPIEFPAAATLTLFSSLQVTLPLTLISYCLSLLWFYHSYSTGAPSSSPLSSYKNLFHILSHPLLLPFIDALDTYHFLQGSNLAVLFLPLSLASQSLPLYLLFPLLLLKMFKARNSWDKTTFLNPNRWLSKCGPPISPLPDFLI